MPEVDNLDPNPETEVQILQRIALQYGVSPNGLGQQEVALLTQICVALGGSNQGPTEVQYLTQILAILAPGEFPGVNEVPLLYQIVTAVGGTPTGTEVTLLLQWLAAIS